MCSRARPAPICVARSVQALAHDPRGDLSARVQPELGQDVGDVPGSCRGADEQLFCDAAVRQTARDQQRDLVLSRRQNAVLTGVLVCTAWLWNGPHAGWLARCAMGGAGCSEPQCITDSVMHAQLPSLSNKLGSALWPEPLPRGYQQAVEPCLRGGGAGGPDRVQYRRRGSFQPG